MKKYLGKISSLLLSSVLTMQVVWADDNGGTTPFLPGSEWRVHDHKRPLPPVVNPGSFSHAPPSDSIVLLGAQTGLEQWEYIETGAVPWVFEKGILKTNPTNAASYDVKISSLRTKEKFGDIQLHLEFKVPLYEAEVTGQKYGNSGIFLMGLYEIQVLNSYENQTYADGQAGALYGWKPPIVNASLPPGHWQSYDIIFEAPQFEANGKLAKAAYVTVFHNGVLIHHRQKFLGATTFREIAKYSAHDKELPLVLQHHGETVHFRNIWVRRLSGLN